MQCSELMLYSGECDNRDCQPHRTNDVRVGWMGATDTECLHVLDVRVCLDMSWSSPMAVLIIRCASHCLLPRTCTSIACLVHRDRLERFVAISCCIVSEPPDHTCSIIISSFTSIANSSTGHTSKLSQCYSVLREVKWLLVYVVGGKLP